MKKKPDWVIKKCQECVYSHGIGIFCFHPVVLKHVQRCSNTYVEGKSISGDKIPNWCPLPNAEEEAE